MVGHNPRTIRLDSGGNPDPDQGMFWRNIAVVVWTAVKTSRPRFGNSPKKMQASRRQIERIKCCLGGVLRLSEWLDSIVLFDFVYFVLCSLAGLCKNYSTDFHKIRWKGGTHGPRKNQLDSDSNLDHLTTTPTYSDCQEKHKNGKCRHHSFPVIKSNQFISETADSKIEIQDNDNVQPLTEYGKAVASANVRPNKQHSDFPNAIATNIDYAYNKNKNTNGMHYTH